MREYRYFYSRCLFPLVNMQPCPCYSSIPSMKEASLFLVNSGWCPYAASNLLLRHSFTKRTVRLLSLHILYAFVDWDIQESPFVSVDWTTIACLHIGPVYQERKNWYNYSIAPGSPSGKSHSDIMRIRHMLHFNNFNHLPIIL